MDENIKQKRGLNSRIPQPIRPDGAGATDNGPCDIMRNMENPDMLVPPVTDAGMIPKGNYCKRTSNFYDNCWRKYEVNSRWS